MRILLADDQPMMRAVVRKNLEKYIYAEIVEAGDGEEALSLFQQGPFDIVISDQWMTKVHGTDLLQHVEKNPKSAAIFILFSSDKSIVHHFQKNQRCPAILKPNLDLLMNCVLEASCINFFT
jgi:DNA-binding NarL/FixJ family response regulator